MTCSKTITTTDPQPAIHAPAAKLLAKRDPPDWAKRVDDAADWVKRDPPDWGKRVEDELDWVKRGGDP